MDLAEPGENERFARREHDFYKIVCFPVGTAGKASGIPWEAFRKPWQDIWGGLRDGLEGPGPALEDLLGGPWENLGRTLWKTLQNPRRLRMP